MINIFLAIDFTTTPEILIFGVVLGALLMFFSRYMKTRLFSVLSVAVWLFMAIQLSDSIALLLVFIGLMIEELYYAFFDKAGE